MTTATAARVALVALTLIDFLRAEPVDEHPPLRQQLAEYLRFLQSLERPDHRFYRQYLLSSGEGWGESSPYFDGEILLALVKAARHLPREDLQTLVLRAADASYAAYAHEAIEQRRDDEATKGYFQWACMACAELYASQWPDTERYAQRAIDLAHWMIDVHRTLDRRIQYGVCLRGNRLGLLSGSVRRRCRFPGAISPCHRGRAGKALDVAGRQHARQCLSASPSGLLRSVHWRDSQR